MRTTCLLVLTVWAAASAAQPGFVFDLPRADSVEAAFLPWFPKTPVGSGDAVTAGPSGHFERRGAPIRFWGVNLTAAGAFPEADEARALAGRLRTLGVNLVRFHHLDNPGPPLVSLFGGRPDTRSFDPATLDRLDRLVAELKRNGVYVNMNLNVSRAFRASDGVADTEAFPTHAKGVTIFDPQLVALQKAYARDLLTHVNPYTGQTLADDPVLAMVEVVNENSLYAMWRHGALVSRDEGGALPVRHARMLDSLWNASLADRYGTTDALGAAWGIGAVGEPETEDAFDGASVAPWQTERHDAARVTATVDTSTPYAGTGSARVRVSTAGAEPWHAQFRRGGFELDADSTYWLTFAARAERARDVEVVLRLDRAPWTYYDGATVSLTTAWQTFALPMRATESVSEGRLTFLVGAEAGSVWLDEVTFGPPPVVGVGAGERVEDRSVRRTPFADRTVSPARLRDQVGFYIDLQTAFFQEMRTFLRDELGVRAPITGTNWNVGVPDLAMQSTMDYTDNHGYWDHPEFPGAPWDPVDWRIRNTPMVADDGGTIPELFGGVRLVGKPMTVSEYNHAFPNQFLSEGPLFLSAYGAFHSADALMLFDYGDRYGAGSENAIRSYFGIHRNPAVTALLPSVAYAYREGLIAPAAQTVELALSAADVRQWPARTAAVSDWRDPLPFPRQLALQHAVVTRTYERSEGDASPARPAAPTPPYVTDTGEIAWDPAGLLTVAAPQFAAATGQAASLTGAGLGPATITEASGHASLTWLALDGAPLPEARRSLLTVATSAENTGMVWDGDRTIHAEWGGAPVVVRPVRIALDASLSADTLLLHPLGPTGDAVGEPVPILPAEGRFELVLDLGVTPTLWFGVELRGNGRAATAEDASAIARLDLLPLAPNPAGEQTRLRFALPTARSVGVSVIDVLGRRVAGAAVDGQAGWNTHTLDVSALAAGVYFIRLDAGSRAVTRPLVVR